MGEAAQGNAMNVLWPKVGEGSREERRGAGPEMVLSPWGLSLLTSFNSVPGSVPEVQRCGHDPDKGPACSPGGDLPNGEEATRNRDKQWGCFGQRSVLCWK